MKEIISDKDTIAECTANGAFHLQDTQDYLAASRPNFIPCARLCLQQLHDPKTKCWNVCCSSYLWPHLLK